MTTAELKRLIVIGASAGGVEALLRLVRALPGNLPASVCVVVHTSPRAKSLLPQLLTRAGQLPAAYAKENELLQPSKIYVAPPDFHMIINGPMLKLNRGPRENLCRPAIDPLFRSASSAFDGAVIGVILSGMLDDGTNGLLSIKSAGGVAMVQEPDECGFTGMPHNAIENVDIDYVLRIDDIAKKLIELCSDPNVKPIVRKGEEAVGHTVDGFSCPDCGGVLREDGNQELLHFTCHVGHRVSAETLCSGQNRSVEKALWSAVRALREQAALSDRLAKRLRSIKHDSVRAEHYDRQVNQAQSEAHEIIALLNRRHFVDDTGGSISMS